MENNLLHLVDTLPAELYNQIRELVFTPLATKRRFIDESYKPHSCIQVSRATRSHFAKSYYGDGAVFFVPRDLAVKWASSLPKEHLHQIGDIRLQHDPTDFREFRLHLYELETRDMVGSNGYFTNIIAFVGEDVLKVKVFLSAQATVWVSLSDLTKTSGLAWRYGWVKI